MTQVPRTTPSLTITGSSSSSSSTRTTTTTTTSPVNRIPVSPTHTYYYSNPQQGTEETGSKDLSPIRSTTLATTPSPPNTTSTCVEPSTNHPTEHTATDPLPSSHTFVVSPINNTNNCSSSSSDASRNNHNTTTTITTSAHSPSNLEHTTITTYPPRTTLKIPPTQKDERKLFVGGLPPDVTDQEFQTFFSQFGEILDCVVLFDRETLRSRGFGFVTFVDPQVSQQLHLNQHLQMRGKTIEIKKAEPKESTSFHANNTSHHHPRPFAHHSTSGNRPRPIHPQPLTPLYPAANEYMDPSSTTTMIPPEMAPMMMMTTINGGYYYYPEYYPPAPAAMGYGAPYYPVPTPPPSTIPTRDRIPPLTPSTTAAQDIPMATHMPFSFSPNNPHTNSSSVSSSSTVAEMEPCTTSSPYYYAAPQQSYYPNAMYYTTDMAGYDPRYGTMTPTTTTRASWGGTSESMARVPPPPPPLPTSQTNRTESRMEPRVIPEQ